MFLCFRAALKVGRGIRVALASVVVVSALYVYLGWDEPPVLLREDQLRPGNGLTRPPREVVLEATADPTFGRVSEWPKSLFVSHKEPPSKEWVLENAVKIRSGWIAVQPIRDWANRLNAWQAFDDYVVTFSEPILEFRPFRQLTVGVQEYALLCSAEGKPDEAMSALAEVIRLGRHFQKGSRALVTLMIGVAVEKSALRTLRSVHEQWPGVIGPYVQALAPTESVVSWEDFDRVLLNEMSMLQISLSTSYARPKSVADWIGNRVSLVLFNPNATLHEYRRYIERASSAARARDFETIEKMEESRRMDTCLFYFKNSAGRHLLHEIIPSLAKVARGVDELIALKSELAAAASAGPNPL